MTNKVNPPPSKPGSAEQKKKPFSMGLPPLPRQPFLQPKALWEKVPVRPPSAKIGTRGRG